MRLYVIRHAHAGSRSVWDGSDDTRPLSKKGRRQAAGIAEQLAGADITRLVSSPAERCVATLAPLATRLGIGVAPDARLREGAGGGGALDLAAELCGGGAGAAAVCSHGDVIPDVLRRLRDGATRIDDPFVWPKASIWVVDWDGWRWVAARYSPPPAT